MLRMISILLFISFAQQGFAQKSYVKTIRQHRKEYKQAFKATEEGPLNKKETRKLKFFKADSTYRVSAKLELTPEAENFKMATYSGVAQPYVQYAKASFVLEGKTYALDIYRSISLSRMPMFRTYLFLPFMDDTNGDSTYGGGRYLSLDIKDVKDGYLEIDFNKAYNPYCAYSEGYSCPIPPEENHLGVAIKAGEKNYPQTY